MNMSVKFFKYFTGGDLHFAKIRKTSTGTRIIDIVDNTLFQTPWLTVMYDVEYKICVNAEKIRDILEEIDKTVVEYARSALNFSEDEILKMYRPLITTTILWDQNKNFYNKPEIKNVIKPGQNVRFIMSFKKIEFKDHELTMVIDLRQIEVL